MALYFFTCRTFFIAFKVIKNVYGYDPLRNILVLKKSALRRYFSSYLALAYMA